METVKEDHGAEFATHGGGEGTEDLVLNKLLGQHFAKNCKQATAYTSHINYAKLLIQ